MDRFAPLAFALLLVAPLAVLSHPAHAQSVETWRLAERQFPVLPESIVNITEGRNAGSFIRVARTPNPNEVAYINRKATRGNLDCLWTSAFTWDDPPQVVNSGQDNRVDLTARFDRPQGRGCTAGRIGLTFGSRADPLRERAGNILRVKAGLAAPSPSTIGPPASTDIFRVNARPDLPQNDTFTVAVHVSDGGVTDQVVALYIYKKQSARTVTPPQPPIDEERPGGTVVRLESMNYPGLFIRHRNYLGELTKVSSDLDRKDSSFRLVPGLADGSMVSFESVNFPGCYLRHQNFRLKLSCGRQDDLFRKDATFRRVPGLANPSLVSFESYNYPGYFIRHRNFHLYIERGNSALFRQDATFRFAAFGS